MIIKIDEYVYSISKRDYHQAKKTAKGLKNPKALPLIVARIGRPRLLYAGPVNIYLDKPEITRADRQGQLRNYFAPEGTLHVPPSFCKDSGKGSCDLRKTSNKTGKGDS